MSQDILKQIGEKICFFRRSKGYTQTDLAAMLHRSKSSLSKYERGETSIDIDVLQEIASVLGLSLIDFFDDASRTMQLFRLVDLPEGESKRLYGYTFQGRQKPRLAKHVFHVGESAAVLYSDVQNMTADLQSMQYTYSYLGEVQRTDSFCRLLLTNSLHQSDIILIEFSRPLTAVKAFWGIIASFSVGQYHPLVTKILLSYTPIGDEKMLVDQLRFTKAEIKAFRTRNALVFN